MLPHETISMSAADLEECDIQAVVEVLRSGRLALGPKGDELERSIAAYVGVEHAVAVSSGTAALHLIMRALGIGPGDEVLVPSFTFIASVNAILYVGSVPVFVDIEPDTYTIDPVDAERKVTSRTRAIMAVDVFGHPAEWDELSALANRYGLSIIDDSCEALGAEYKGVRLGRFGAAAAFAFYPNKQITTGEGGIVVTDDPSVAAAIRSFRNQGRTGESAWLEHDTMGYNYRMDEMSAALGVSQLKRIGMFLEKRERVARLYNARLDDQDWVRVQRVKPYVKMSWFVYVVTLCEGVKRERVIRDMSERGIPARGYFSPIHMQSYIRERCGTGPGMLPVTEGIAERTIALPFHNRISEAQVEAVVAGLKRAVDCACIGT